MDDALIHRSMRDLFGLHESTARIMVGDARELLPKLDARSISCVITSPPYFNLRDYDNPQQIGVENDLQDYLRNIAEVFGKLRGALREGASMWVNIGDSYAGSNKGWMPKTGQNVGGKKQTTNLGTVTGSIKPTGIPEGLKRKDLLCVPWRVVEAIETAGFVLLADLVWYRPNAMPESVEDRLTRSHEYVFCFALADADAESVRQGIRWHRLSRDGGSVLDIAVQPVKGHHAVFPKKLVRVLLEAATQDGDVVLDPFGGSGTTGVVAAQMGRDVILCELNPDYATRAKGRILAEGVSVS